MPRLTQSQLNALMKKEDCDRIWSWSKINTFMISPYEYYLKYILKEKEDRKDCIYATTGGIAHDILEKYYTKQIEYKDMISLFQENWTAAFDIMEMKFDRNDEEKNLSIANHYKYDLQHFFTFHSLLKHKPMIEQFVKINLDGILIQGYIDACMKDDDDNYTILDWKTSSKYSVKTADEKAGQLVIYALGLHKAGIPIEKIKICWNFLKYVDVEYTQKNGKTKTRTVERYKIGDALQSNAKMWLSHYGYEPDEYLKELLDSNSIDNLPEPVKEKYKITDCFVYVPLTNSLIQSWVDKVKNTVTDIELREADYEKYKSDKSFWDSPEQVEKESYYFSTLCGYSRKLHKPFDEYCSKIEKRKKDSEIRIVGNTNLSEDLSWLNEI